MEQIKVFNPIISVFMERWNYIDAKHQYPVRAVRIDESVKMVNIRLWAHGDTSMLPFCLSITKTVVACDLGKIASGKYLDWKLEVDYFDKESKEKEWQNQISDNIATTLLKCANDDNLWKYLDDGGNIIEE